MRLTSTVRSALKPSRSACTASCPCCSAVFTGTKRMLGREAASQMAAASLASFLPDLPAMRQGVTRCPAIRRASSPSSRSRRATWCAPPHAFHCDEAARGQRRAPSVEALGRQRLSQHDGATSIHRVDLVLALGQIHPYPRDGGTCNLHLDFPFPAQIELPQQFNLGTSIPSWDWGSPFVFARADALRQAA